MSQCQYLMLALVMCVRAFMLDVINLKLIERFSKGRVNCPELKGQVCYQDSWGFNHERKGKYP